MKVYLLISLLFNFILSKFQSTIAWGGASLSNYTATKIKNIEENLNYIIIDPDEILDISKKNITLEKMKNFYLDKKVINYIVIFYEMDNTESNLENIINNFSSKMKNLFTDYKENYILISAFAINARKSRMKTGENVKEHISDSTALEILNNRQTEMRNQNYDKAMEDLIDDIIKKYDSRSGSTILAFIIFIIFFGVCYVFNMICKRYCGGCNGGDDDSGYSSDWGGDSGGGGDGGGGGGASSDW